MIKNFMMRKKRFDQWKKRLAAGAAVLTLALGMTACEPEDLTLSLVPPETEADAGTYASLPVRIDVAASYGHAATRASLLENAEQKKSGALLLVYRSANRQLESYRYFSAEELDAADPETLEITVPMTECDFYLLGNLHAIHRETGEAASLPDALGTDFPVDETSLEAFVYRLDGGALNENWRRETMAEVRTYGLPFSCVEKGVDVTACVTAGESVPRNPACWMFSKVVIRVDHRLFDGGDASKLDYFVNKELYVRQANLHLRPFSGSAVRASEAADSGTGDYDAAMSNAGAGEYVFYIPENMQGTVPGIVSGAGKNKDNVSVIPAAVRDYATYVEFRGTLNREAGGFGGDVTYQFYLGANETSDFNLQRGVQYNVSLSFTADALFNPPEWKVNPELTDSRLFRLTADADFTTDIGDVNASRMLAVRKNRPGRFYLYMNPSGRLGAANSLVGKFCETPASFVMDDLSDCAWYGDLMSAETADARWLSDRGIRAGWDAASACLAFSVTDPDKFERHKGESNSFELRLLPGGTMRASFTLRLADDLVLTLADGQSLTDEFYLGQKRTISVSGFTGTDLRYAAVQEQCGARASSDKNANVQWKSSSAASADFPKCALDGQGNVLLDPRNGVYSGQRLTGGRLEVYAFYPNRFQASRGWTSRNGRIIIFSEDYLNDSVEAEIRISEPRLKTCILTGFDNRAILPIDGTPVDAGGTFGYMNFDGSGELAKDSFDAALYADRLAFSEELPSSGWGEYIGFDYEKSLIYCKKTTGPNGNLENASYSGNGVTNIQIGNSFIVKANPATGLFSGNVYQRLFDYSRLQISSYSADGSAWTPRGVDVPLRINYFVNRIGLGFIRNQYVDDESFSIRMQYRFRNSDTATLEIVRNGAVSEYTCQNGEKYGPVFELVTDTFDSGSGGRLEWRYDESRQVMQASDGEPVPGGLLLPYGKQTVTFNYRNRWDGRTFSTESDELDFTYSFEFCFFVGATNRRLAQVFFVPAKNAKYLMRCASRATPAQRSWMTKLFGHRDWSDSVLVDRAYPYNGPYFFCYRKEYLQDTGTTATLPLNDFDVSWVPGCGAYTRWNQTAIEHLHDEMPYENTAFFQPNHFGKQFVRYKTPSTSMTYGIGTAPMYLSIDGSDQNFLTSFDMVKGVFVNETGDFAY